MRIPADFRKLLRVASFVVVFFTMMTSGVAGEIHVAINEERFEDAIKLLEADEIMVMYGQMGNFEKHFSDLRIRLQQDIKNLEKQLKVS